MKKRILSILIVTMMVIELIPATALTAFATETNVASVTTTGGTTTNYTSLNQAVNAAKTEENSTVTLLADVNEVVTAHSGKFTIDLNGKIWTSDYYTFTVLDADVVITDNSVGAAGKITTSVNANAIVMHGDHAKLEIAGGTVETMTGLKVSQVNIHAQGISFKKEKAEKEEAKQSKRS